MLKSIDDFSYVTSTVITPLFLVAGTFFPLTGLPDWVHYASNANPLFHCVELVHHAASASRAGSTSAISRSSSASRSSTWRLAIHYMARRVID